MFGNKSEKVSMTNRTTGKYSYVHVTFLEDVDLLRKLKKKSPDGSQPFSGAGLFHVDSDNLFWTIDTQIK